MADEFADQRGIIAWSMSLEDVLRWATLGMPVEMNGDAPQRLAIRTEQKGQ